MEDIKKEVEEIINKSVEEKVKVIESSLNEEMKKQLEEKEISSQGEIKSLQETLESLKKDNEEKTQTIKSLAEKINQETIKPIPFSERIRKSIYKEAIKEEVKKNLEEIKSLNGNDIKKEYKLEVAIEKAAGTVLRSNIVNAEGNPAFVAYSPIEQGVARVQQRRPYLRELVNVGTVEGAYARWTEATSGEGNADVVGEGERKPQRDQDWVLKEQKVEKIAVFTKVSEETLEDIDWVAEEIAADLVEQLLLKEDELIYKGTGSNNQYKGLISFAQQFVVSDSVNAEFYQKIAFANEIDVIRVASAIIAKNNFVPNVVLLNPADAARMDLLKTTNGAYLMIKNGNNIWNIQVLENTGVSVGDFLIGDFTKANYRLRKDVTMYAGREGEDLVKNLFTIVFELRGVFYVKGVDSTAFIKGTFDSAITSITGNQSVQSINVEKINTSEE